VALFKPYDNGSASSETTQSPTETPTQKMPAKKSVPTPTRKQAEQARRDRIQPVLTKKQANLKNKEARYKAQNEAMAKVHARPVNALIRDWVDHRFNLAEFGMPAMLLIFAAMLVGSYAWPPLVMVLPWVVYGVAILMVIDISIMFLGLRHQIRIYFPGESMKGKWGYAFSRAVMFRRSRSPAPRIKRGTKFTWPNPEDR